MRWLYVMFAGSKHPRHVTSLRWRIAQYSAFNLVFGGLGVLLSLALVMALIYIGTEEPGPGLPHAGRRLRPLWLMLDTLRALLGASDATGQIDNLAHQVLTTFASIVGALFPALVIGIAIVRLFNIRVFEWRRTINACLAAELDDELRAAIADPAHAFLAVRWYKRLNNLALVNLRAEAYLRVRTVSEHDGSTFYRYQLLNVVDLSGNTASACVWPETFSGMPFTLWIPIGDALVGGEIVKIQGRHLTDGDDRHLVVRLTGNISVGPTTQVSEEHRYHLRDDVQIGRFVPVDPDIYTASRSWPGWRDFDRQVTHNLFVYAELMSPDELRQILGREPEPGEIRRATLRNWRVGWQVCSDNTDPDRKSTFFLPGSDTAEAVQVLFPTASSDPGATLDGLIVPVTPAQLADLDRREGIYMRRRVNDRINIGNNSELSGVVWMYTGRPDLVERAANGVRQGTARIDQALLARIQDAYNAHPGLADAFGRIPLPRVPIIDLERQPHSTGEEDADPD